MSFFKRVDGDKVVDIQLHYICETRLSMLYCDAFAVYALFWFIRQGFSNLNKYEFESFSGVRCFFLYIANAVLLLGISV